MFLYVFVYFFFLLISLYIISLSLSLSPRPPQRKKPPRPTLGVPVASAGTTQGLVRRLPLGRPQSVSDMCAPERSTPAARANRLFASPLFFSQARTSSVGPVQKPFGVGGYPGHRTPYQTRTASVNFRRSMAADVFLLVPPRIRPSSYPKLPGDVLSCRGLNVASRRVGSGGAKRRFLGKANG